MGVTTAESPGKLTDLGVAQVEALDDLDAERVDVALCFDAVAPLYQYADAETVFQFFQVLTRQVTASGVAAHYHLNPAAVDDHDRRTLEVLFDDVLAIAEDGCSTPSAP